MDYHEIHTKIWRKYRCPYARGKSHFNLFAVINDEVNIGPGIYHICQNVLNNALQVTKVSQKKPEISFGNCLLAGFPILGIGKYANILRNSNYTVVIVDHKIAPPNYMVLQVKFSPGANV